MDETKYLYGAAVIISMSYYMLLSFMISLSILIAEGILALHDPALRALYDLKVGRLICFTYQFLFLTPFLQIFVQCDSDLMLARRLRRDIKERGRTVDGTLDQ